MSKFCESMAMFTYMRQIGNVDFKFAAAARCTPSRSFKISDTRVLMIDRNKLGSKTFSDKTTIITVLRKGRRWQMFQSELIPMINCVKKAKKANVLKLIDELGGSETVTI